MTRAYVQAQPNPPLANTGTGAAGTVLGTERAKLNNMPAWVVGDKTKLDAMPAWVVGDKTKLDPMPAWVAADKTNVDANTAARHTHANLAVLDATTASFTTSDESRLDNMYNPVVHDTDAMASEVALGNAGWTLVLSCKAEQTTSRPHLVCGHITFRNGVGSTTTMYFRVRHVASGTTLASGQLEVTNGQRGTIGFSAIMALGVVTDTDVFSLEARSAAASGAVATHVNGLSEGSATRISNVPVGA